MTLNILRFIFVFKGIGDNRRFYILMVADGFFILIVFSRLDTYGFEDGRLYIFKIGFI